jgi:hypothetical protein
MVAYVRTRPQVLLAKVEVTEGTDVTPTLAANAVKIENINWTDTPNVIQSNEHSGALDVSAPINRNSFRCSSKDACFHLRKYSRYSGLLGSCCLGSHPNNPSTLVPAHF